MNRHEWAPFRRQWIAQYYRAPHESPRELELHGYPITDDWECPVYCLTVSIHGYPGTLIYGPNTNTVLDSLKETDGTLCARCLFTFSGAVRGMART